MRLQEEKRLLSDYANTFGVSLSEFVRSSALERVEVELDLCVWDEAKAKHEADQHTLAAAEISAKYL